MHDVTILGFHFSGNGLPYVTSVRWALEKKNLDLGRSTVNNNLNLANDPGLHGVSHSICSD